MKKRTDGLNITSGVSSLAVRVRQGAQIEE